MWHVHKYYSVLHIAPTSCQNRLIISAKMYELEQPNAYIRTRWDWSLLSTDVFLFLDKSRAVVHSICQCKSSCMIFCSVASVYTLTSSRTKRGLTRKVLWYFDLLIIIPPGYTYFYTRTIVLDAALLYIPRIATHHGKIWTGASVYSAFIRLPLDQSRRRYVYLWLCAL